MHTLTPRQTVPSNPADLEARILAVDQRVAAIDDRLSEIRQRLLAIDRTLAVPTQLAQGETLTARFGTWLTAFGRAGHARPLASAPAAAPSLQ